ncbi:hypothetical protein [Streptomyces sp. 1222.5]|uniref:hypothetical protein n=1 Tax=Streptomyces sp. 1222.5 TaxID=1881026 RepID=UPI003EBE6C92
MAHRPFPNRERARRQVDRHHGTVPSWAQARTRTDAPPPALRADAPLAALRLVDGSHADEYRLSTR